MSTKMTREEQESALRGVHVAVLCIAEEGRGPLAVPVWYSYDESGEIRFVTGKSSRKGKLLKPGVRISLCVQNEQPPYLYVSVEGPVVAVSKSDLEADVRPLAHRYLGVEAGDSYVESTLAGSDDEVLIRMKPERWYAADYSKRQL